METIIRNGPMRLSLDRDPDKKYLKAPTVTELIEKCQELDEQGFDYMFKIRRVLETISDNKDENPHLFKGCIKKERERGFYYEVVMRKVN